MRNRFRKLTSREVRLDEVNQDIETKDACDKDTFLRGKLAHMFVLEDKLLERNICLVNVHLFHDPKYEFVKVAQFAYLGKEIAKLR